MRGRELVSTCLKAIFPPVVGEVKMMTPPSHDLKEAVERLSAEADRLIVEIKGELPFHDTIRDIADRMS